MADGERALALPHRRALRRVARAIRATEAGVLVYCVGRSVALRAQWVEALGEAIGGRGVASVVLEDDDDIPWTRITEAAEGGAVVSLSFAQEPPSVELLQRINFGREVGSARRVSLLVWMGLAALGDVQRGAADLWAYRTGVEYLWSWEDFVGGPVVAPILALPSELERLDRDLTWTWGSTRVQALIKKAQWFLVLGLQEEARTILETQEVADSPLSQRFYYLHLLAETAWLREDLHEVELVLDRIQWHCDHTATQVVEFRYTGAVARFRLACLKQRWAEMLELLQSLWRLMEQYKERLRRSIDGPMAEFADAARSLVQVGYHAVASNLLMQAESEIEEVDPNEWPDTKRLRGSISLLKGDIGWEHLDTQDSLSLTCLSQALLDRDLYLNTERHALAALVDRFTAIGLQDDAFLARAQIKLLDAKLASLRAGEPLRPTIITAGTQCEEALTAAESALAANDLPTAAASLEKARAHHAAEDAQYPSLYRASRIARLSAKLAVHTGYAPEALPLLQSMHDRLDAMGLHRERLTVLTDIAALPPDVAPWDTRMKAARTAHRLATGAGLLAPERDALRARIALEREANPAADVAAHETTLAELDEALA